MGTYTCFIMIQISLQAKNWIVVDDCSLETLSTFISLFLKGMVKGIVCARKNKEMNWVLFVAWNINQGQVCKVVHDMGDDVQVKMM